MPSCKNNVLRFPEKGIREEGAMMEFIKKSAKENGISEKGIGAIFYSLDEFRLPDCCPRKSVVDITATQNRVSSLGRNDLIQSFFLLDCYLWDSCGDLEEEETKKIKALHALIIDRLCSR